MAYGRADFPRGDRHAGVPDLCRSGAGPGTPPGRRGGLRQPQTPPLSARTESIERAGHRPAPAPYSSDYTQKLWSSQDSSINLQTKKTKLEDPAARYDSEWKTDNLWIASRPTRAGRLGVAFPLRTASICGPSRALGCSGGRPANEGILLEGTKSLMAICVRSETTISRHGCVRGRARADQGADPRRGGRSRREAMGNGSCDGDSKATRSPEAGSSRTLPGAKSALTRPLANHWSVAVSPWHGTGKIAGGAGASRGSAREYPACCHRSHDRERARTGRSGT